MEKRNARDNDKIHDPRSFSVVDGTSLRDDLIDYGTHLGIRVNTRLDLHTNFEMLWWFSYVPGIMQCTHFRFGAYTPEWNPL